VKIQWENLMYYAMLMSVFSCLMMGFDKKRSMKRGARRISERTLWMYAILGGALGTWLGMLMFRHKTQKTSFKYGIPLLVLIQWGYFTACAAGLLG